MNKLLILIVISLTTLTFAFAQNADESNPLGAREVMLKFVELNNKQLLQTDAARQLFSGSATDWKMAWFGQISASPDKIVLVKQDFSVARVQTVQKNSRVVDLYFYLRFENDWKVRSAIMSEWEKFPEKNRAWLESTGIIRYDDILEIDDNRRSLT